MSPKLKPIGKKKLAKMEAQPEEDWTVVIWEDEDGETTEVRITSVVFSGGHWVEPSASDYAHPPFYSLKRLPDILKHWQWELERS